MGALVEYSCPACGYQSEALALGLAPYPDRYAPCLVSCPECRKLQAVDVRKVPEGCRKHGVPFVEHAEGKPVPCPACGGALAEGFAGLWD
jgi:hypothetical protein